VLMRSAAKPSGGDPLGEADAMRSIPGHRVMERRNLPGVITGGLLAPPASARRGRRKSEKMASPWEFLGGSVQLLSPDELAKVRLDEPVCVCR